MKGLPVNRANAVNAEYRAKQRAIWSTPCKSTSTTVNRVWVQPATSQSTPATFPLATATPLPLLTQHRQQVILVHTTLLPQQRTIFQTHNATRFTSCETCSGAATIRPRPLQVEIKMYTYFPDSVHQLILFIYFNCPLVIVFSSAVRHLWHSKKLKYIFQLFRNYFKSKNVEM